MSLSPNRNTGRNGQKADIIVCHVTEGSFDGSVSWVRNSAAQVSYHAIVGADGRIAELVNLSDTAWSNGTTTDSSRRQFHGNATARFVRERRANANSYTYSIGHEGFSTKDRFGALTEAQYKTSLSFMKKCITHMRNTYGITFKPDREHLIGHYQIDPRGKPNCPAPNQGANFPFDRFITDIKAWMAGGTNTSSAGTSSAGTSSAGTSAAAQEPIIVSIDGVPVVFETPTQMINDRVMIQIRPVAQKLGCNVVWDESTQTSYINQPNTPLQRTATKGNSINVYVNNKPIAFPDQKPIMHSGYVLVPSRAVIEALGHSVTWINSTRTQNIVTGKNT